MTLLVDGVARQVSDRVGAMIDHLIQRGDDIDRIDVGKVELDFSHRKVSGSIHRSLKPIRLEGPSERPARIPQEVI